MPASTSTIRRTFLVRQSNYSVEMVQSVFTDQFILHGVSHAEGLRTLLENSQRSPTLAGVGHVFRREFPYHEDAHFFHKTEGKKLSAGQLPLYEGKMIHQFDKSFFPAGYFVVRERIREELICEKKSCRSRSICPRFGSKKTRGKACSGQKDELAERLRQIFKAKSSK